MFPYPLFETFIVAGFRRVFKWFIFLYDLSFGRVDEHYDGFFTERPFLSVCNRGKHIVFVKFGVEFAIGRALLPVSSHALFGVIMGYYFGKAKFSKWSKNKWIFFALFIPIFLHGLYDYILLIKGNGFHIIVPFMLILWGLALKKVKKVKMEQRYIHSGRDTTFS